LERGIQKEKRAEKETGAAEMSNRRMAERGYETREEISAKRNENIQSLGKK